MILLHPGFDRTGADRLKGVVHMGLFGSSRKKHGLYYLLPGMSRANRQKRKRVFRWSLVVGLLVSAMFAGLLWWFNR